MTESDYRDMRQFNKESVHVERTGIPHIWSVTVLFCDGFLPVVGYTYSDEAEGFGSRFYSTPEQAKEALDEYCKHLG